jgi:hypothetical protein
VACLNQRAKNKVRLGGFMPRELVLHVRKLARGAGMSKNVFGFAMMLVQEELEKVERKGRRAKRTSGGNG